MNWNVFFITCSVFSVVCMALGVIVGFAAFIAKRFGFMAAVCATITLMILLVSIACGLTVPVH